MNKYALILMLVLSGTIYAQKTINVEDFTTQNKFRSKSVRGIRWMNDGQFYSALRDNKIVKYDVTTGNEVAVIINGNELTPSIRINGYEFSNDEQKLLLLTDRESIYRRSFTAVYYVVDLKTKEMQKLANGRQSYATFSPDGGKVAFTRDNNLFFVTLGNMEEIQVTRDGKFNYIINGSTDWVYEEELSITKAFFWSPDNKNIAYYRFDEGHVKEFNMQLWNNGALYPKDYKYKYPKAGEENSFIEIKIFNLESKKIINVDIGSEKDIYIPRIEWTKNPDILSVRRLNRLQNKMEILHVDASKGNSNLVLIDESGTYVDVESLVYLDDAKHMIITSERSGFRHIYLFTVEGNLVRQITTGNWEVSSFVGIDQSVKKATLFYTSREKSPLERHFYSIDIKGKNKKLLSVHEGMNSVNISNDFKYFLIYNSSNMSPNRVELYETKNNSLIKVLESNEELKKVHEEYGIVEKEFFTFKTVDDILLNGYMLKPSEMDEGKKYPVLMFQYSAPGSQSVSNSFGGRHWYWHQLLVQKGYIIAVVDGRGTGAQGAKFKKQTYKQLGKHEVEDQIEAAKYLGGLPYIDAERIGIWGWSYGGYMSSLAILRGNDVFKAAIAVAPVTSWRYYDTIYTERYLSTPQDNPSGYDDNSPITYAANLKGNFLLIHGTGDDNVHYANAVALSNALIKNNKQFESFYYPDRAHGIRKQNAKIHLYTMMTNFILENL